MSDTNDAGAPTTEQKAIVPEDVKGRVWLSGGMAHYLVYVAEHPLFYDVAGTHAWRHLVATCQARVDTVRHILSTGRGIMALPAEQIPDNLKTTKEHS